MIMCLALVINIEGLALWAFLHNRGRMIFSMKQKLPGRFFCGLGNLIQKLNRSHRARVLFGDHFVRRTTAIDGDPGNATDTNTDVWTIIIYHYQV